MIGHNGPPPLEAFSLHIEELFALASGSVAAPVANDEQEAALDSLLDDLRKARKDADVQRAVEKKPHDDAGKAVQAAWKPLLDRCDSAVDAIKACLTPYRTARQAAKDAEAVAAREAAEAERLAAQEALRQADDLEAQFAAEERLKLSTKLEATANRIDRAPTGLRTRQVAVVEDYKALLQHIMANDPAPLKAWLDDYARRVLPAVLPGVRSETERKAA